ncbi:MAG TPA: molybdate ABC transporter substrate-binding protein [Conexibacter sp.]|nr:molybdate ABC transporter substrate-binding protein [Conexibacter sp.]
MTKRLTAALLAAIVAVAMAACGSSDDSSSSTTADDGGDLVVSAASSLTDAFPVYARSLDGTVRFQFAGSDELAAQIRQGVKPDVFAAASPRFPDQLHEEGLVGRPVVFATNQLVLAVPQDSDIRSLADLAKSGTTIAIGSPEVPIGSYTRDVLDRLGPAQSKAILANVRSEEPDVKGIVGKLAQGAVDAGFVYGTDVAAADAQVRAITLPARLQPQVVYEAAVVTDAPHPQAARRFVTGLLRGDAQTALKEAGFGAPQTAAKG